MTSRRVDDRVPPRTLWAALLAGPIVATVHFLVVYLAAEAACRPGIDDFGTSALRVVIYAVTAGAAAALVVAGAHARRLRRSPDREAHAGSDTDADAIERADERVTRRFLGSTGLIVLGMFVFMVLLVTAPTIGSTLC